MKDKINLWIDLGGPVQPLLIAMDHFLNTGSALRNRERRLKKAAIQDYPRLLKILYRLYTGESLDISKPRSFNEKIQWLKLYDVTPLKTRLSDKYLAREWVADKIGDHHLIPLLGVWDSFDEIDFDTLPESFILRCNHGSGMNLIVKDKNGLKRSMAKKQFDKWMRTNYAFRTLELQYRDIPRKILAEKYIEQKDGNLLDYKIHVFNGDSKIIQIIGERDLFRHTAKECFLTPEWTPQNLMYHTYDPYDNVPDKPENIDEMIYIAETLGKSFKYVRVDLYNLDGDIRFGEMTFTPMSGYGKWDGDEQYQVGSWIDLE